MKLIHFAQVTEDGINWPKRMGDDILNAFRGKRIKVTTETKKKTRSSEQNRYYWGCVVPFVTLGLIECGTEGLQMGRAESHTTVHEFLKDRFLENGLDFVVYGGEVIKGPSSTTGLTTTEMMNYIADITKFAKEFLNVEIPGPGEQVEIF